MPSGPGSRARRGIAAAAYSVAFLGLLIVAGSRVRVLAAPGAMRLDATGETRFYGWAYRDPALMASLSALAPSLSRGKAVFVTCSPRCDSGWIWVMAAYGLPAQSVVGAGAITAREGIAPTRLEWTRTGVRIVGRRGGRGRG